MRASMPVKIGYGIALLFLMGDAASSTGPGAITSATPKAAQGSQAPAAPAQQPVTQTGTGSKVTPHFTLAAGSYKVVWSATGHNNFIVHVRASGTDDSIINEIPPQPASGETVYDAAGGDYFLQVDGANLKWSVTFSPA